MLSLSLAVKLSLAKSLWPSRQRCKFLDEWETPGFAGEAPGV